MPSTLATDDGPDGRMTQEELVNTALRLLVAGHETTFNLIPHGRLTLLQRAAVCPSSMSVKC